MADCAKRPFGEYEADREIERCARKFDYGLSHRLEQRKYLCPECGMWHLTSKPLIITNEMRRYMRGGRDA